MKPISYVNIYTSSQKGSKSNENGKYSILVKNEFDTIYFRALGFQSIVLTYLNNKFDTILLTPNSRKISTVNIKPSDNSYLFKLIDNTKKNIPKTSTSSKAYFELKSYINNKQVELLESYYNVSTSGYDLKSMNLKAGRIGLKPDSFVNRYFTSQESSQAILDLKIFDTENENFPTSPLWIGKQKMKKKFYLDLTDDYVNNNGDSIFVINYTPKDTSGYYFKGTIWVNKTKSFFEKISLNCAHAKLYPFFPIHKSDGIKNVDFNITVNYHLLNLKPCFNQIDFEYTINYLSRVNWKFESMYSVTTKAILYTYDEHKPVFDLPKFSLSQLFMKDYSMINAYPYNDFFWRYNDENKLHANKIENETFFSDTSTRINIDFFNLLSKKSKLRFMYERPFIHWSKNRIIFKEDLSIAQPQFDKETLKEIHKELRKSYSEKQVKIVERLNGSSFKPNNFSIKLFLDINTYGDSTNVLTSTVIDPYESFCYLLLDGKTHCVINILFDSHEMLRKMMEEELKTFKNNKEKIEKIYSKYNIKRSEYNNSIVKLLEYDYNFDNLEAWNKIILDNLGIDNKKIFEVKEKEE